MTEASQKQKYFWNLLGSLSIGVISFVFMILVSRLLSNAQADSYSLAYALGHSLSIIALFQVRNFQATDVKETYSFETYFFARVITCLVTLLVSIAYLLHSQPSLEKGLAILLISCYRITDAFSDVFQGFFQQHDRIDLAGKSLFWRNSLILLGFGLVLYFTRDLNYALMVICLLSVIFILVFDWQQMQRLLTIDWKACQLYATFQLLGDCFPLFIAGFLLAYIYNQPKYALESYLDLGALVSGSQKIFAILFMPAFVLNLLMLFVRPWVTMLAVHVDMTDWIAFRQLKRKIFGGLLLVTGLILLGGYWLGLSVLGIIYGENLSDHQLTFMLLLLGGCLSSFANVYDQLLTIFRRQKLLLIAYCLAFIVSLVSSVPLIGQFGLMGGALSFVLAMLIWLLCLIMSYHFIARRIMSHARFNH